MDIFYLLHSGIMATVLTKGVSWLTYKGVCIEHMNNLGCRLMNYLELFLLSSRININVMQSILCSVNSTVGRSWEISARVLSCGFSACLLIGAIQSLFITPLFNMWLVHDRFFCSPDPLWDKSLVMFARVHNTLFCQGLIQACVTVILNLTMIPIFRRIRYALQCVILIQSSKCEVFDSLNGIYRRLRRFRRRARITMWHTTTLAILRIFRSIMHFYAHQPVYSPRKETQVEDKCVWIVYLQAYVDLFTLAEFILISWHIGWFLLWSRDVRRWCITSFAKLFCNNRDLLGLLAYSLQNCRPDVRPFDQLSVRSKHEREMETFTILRGLTEEIPAKCGLQATRWLMKRNDLPFVLSVIRTRFQRIMEEDREKSAKNRVPRGSLKSVSTHWYL
ncbi:unnamed protein product [Calicophoron daubneyi]|uniref:Uncharacterized protein n=1 Tax=Calicophoron daubneyi TaxID=300641 RepID=A0AAV2TS59_CALDB